MRSRFALIFAASGAAALIYEVTWTRLLTLRLGHGVAAASTVLAAFMGGLAIGSAIGGRRAATFDPARALRVYAGLELLIGLLALLLPFGLLALDPLLAATYSDGAGGATFGTLRLVTSLLLLSLPAAAMGATFPIASRWFVKHAGQAARDAGALYASNTVGAAIGALLAGFVLLPFLGLAGATWVGVGLNAIAAGGGWWIASQLPQEGPGRIESPVNSPSKSKGAKHKRAAAHNELHRVTSPAIAAAALGATGFASLALQVVWTRVLALVLGPTTYAFSTMVAVFIAGLAIGAALASRLVTRLRNPVAGLAMCLALAVGFGALSAASVDRGLLAIAAVVARPDVTFAEVLSRQAILAIALLAPMTIAFGAAFPFAVAIGTRRDETVTSDLGLIYAVNTAGAITGALLAGFVLIPSVGLHGTIRVVTVIGAVGALALCFVGRVRGSAGAVAGATAVVVLAWGILLPPGIVCSSPVVATNTHP